LFEQILQLKEGQIRFFGALLVSLGLLTMWWV
jgi:uncharacterized protein YjeT (DUF2065 family)